MRLAVLAAIGCERMVKIFCLSVVCGGLVACAAAQGPGVGAGDASVDAAERAPLAAPDGSSQDEPAAQDAGQSQSNAPVPAKLCDGSQDMRLVWQLDDQIRAIAYPFLVPYGTAFFAVDGACRFHALRDYRAGYVTGTLSAEQASELSRDLALAELMQVGSQSYFPASGCVDIPARVATTSAGTVRCGCGCPVQTPEAISLALQTNAELWLERMLAQGEPLNTAVVSALAIPREARYVPDVEPKAWPLTQRMDTIANLKLSDITDARWSKGPYARIEVAQDVAALRALRATDLMAKADTLAGAQVQEDAKVYRLYVRDELPDDVAQAVRAAQQR